jgi:hypothetical protein
MDSGVNFHEVDSQVTLHCEVCNFFSLIIVTNLLSVVILCRLRGVFSKMDPFRLSTLFKTILSFLFSALPWTCTYTNKIHFYFINLISESYSELHNLRLPNMDFNSSLMVFNSQWTFNQKLELKRASNSHSLLEGIFKYHLIIMTLIDFHFNNLMFL